MSQLSLSYLESGRYLDMEDLQDDLDFQRLASFAAIVSDVHFMICDTEGHVLLSTDETPGAAAPSAGGTPPWR